MARVTTERRFIWEDPDWPRFSWDGARLAGALDSARRSQGELLGVVKAIGGLAASEAAEGWRSPLTLERICQWHRALFPKRGSGRFPDPSGR